MKKFLTLLLGILFVFGAFAQPKEVLYLTTPVPFATGPGLNDQPMSDIIEALGYVVTPEQISATSSTTGFDCCFTSEAIPSGDGGWIAYKTAPMPMVMAKVFAIKSAALGWVAEGGCYGNSPDSILQKVNDHEICTGLDDEFQISVPGCTEGAIGAYVNFDAENPAGIEVVYDMLDSAHMHAVVAIAAGSTLNGNTLSSKVAILGIHQVVYDELNDNAARLTDNCLRWVMGLAPNSINDNDAVIATTTVYPNPSNGMVNIEFNHVTSAQITILALDGRTIRTNDIYNVESTLLDLSDLNSGIYIINITGTDINYTQSICLQK